MYQYAGNIYSQLILLMLNIHKCWFMHTITRNITISPHTGLDVAGSSTALPALLCFSAGRE